MAVSSSPGSESETETKQHEEVSGSTAAKDPEIDLEHVHQLPGEGGPDDAGDIDLDGVELHVPGRE